MFSVGRIVLSKRHANAFANQRRVRLGSIFVDPIQPNPIQSNTRMDPTTSTSESAMLWLIKSCNSFPPLYLFFRANFHETGPLYVNRPLCPSVLWHCWVGCI